MIQISLIRPGTNVAEKTNIAKLQQRNMHLLPIIRPTAQTMASFVVIVLHDLTSQRHDTLKQPKKLFQMKVIHDRHQFGMRLVSDDNI